MGRRQFVLARIPPIVFLIASLLGCARSTDSDGRTHSVESPTETLADDDLKLGQKVPSKPEADAVGAAKKKIKRGTPEFSSLVKNTNSMIVFKNEEGDDDDQWMSVELNRRADALAKAVRAEWPSLKLRVTEAWDEDDEHEANSTHYEARAIDITTSDLDEAKLGRLGRLAVNAGFGWVWYEDKTHVHASVR